MELPLPAACSVALVADVVAERQAGRHAAFFAGIEAEWRQRVQDYVDHGGSPAHVGKWPAVDVRRKTFHNLYSSAKAGTAHGDAIGPIRGHELVLCPTCGEPGRPNTLDHDLPKAAYPHLAITPANLVPMCDACQGEKKEKTGNAASPRFFIHPYFDRFSRPQIVRLAVAPPFSTPTFAIGPDPGLTPDEAALVRSHLRELGVAERYVAFFRNEWRRLLRNVSHMRARGQDVAETLEGFRHGAEHPTPNSWQHVFYSGVVADAALMGWLEAGALPPFP